MFYLKTMLISENISLIIMKRLMIGEMETMRKEVVMAQVKLLSMHLPGGAHDNHKTRSQNVPLP
jgi:hypothetical protein